MVSAFKSEKTMSVIVDCWECSKCHRKYATSEEQDEVVREQAELCCSNNSSNRLTIHGSSRRVRNLNNLSHERGGDN